MKLESLAYFENFGERCLADLDVEKDEGKKVAGIYCIFAPIELIRAAGVIPIGLCGKKQEPIDKAEEILPTNLCPLIKSSYGYAISETCPFFAYSDFIIGETTCDGKKKMFELLGRIKPLFLMQLPYAVINDHAFIYWLEEIFRLKSFLEKQTGKAIDLEELRKQIRLQNNIRRLFQKIMVFFRDGDVPISGMEMLSVFESKGFFVDPMTYIHNLERFVQELGYLEKKKALNSDPGAPRILLTGTPIGKGSEKVLRLIEECGGGVVCLENCTGVKSIYDLVDEDEKDPYVAIARRYLQIPCSCMTPNHGRVETIGRLIEEFNIHGVVDLTWHCCHTYNIESYRIKEFVDKKYQIPLLHIETDYSTSDTGQLKTRIEAFLEMLQ